MKRGNRTEEEKYVNTKFKIYSEERRKTLHLLLDHVIKCAAITRHMISWEDKHITLY